LAKKLERFLHVTGTLETTVQKQVRR